MMVVKGAAGRGGATPVVNTPAATIVIAAVAVVCGTEAGGDGGAGDGDGEEVVDGVIAFGVRLTNNLKVFHDVDGAVLATQRWNTGRMGTSV